MSGGELSLGHGIPLSGTWQEKRGCSALRYHNSTRVDEGKEKRPNYSRGGKRRHVP